MTIPDLRPATVAAHAGGKLDEVTGAVTPPIHPSTTYARDGDYGLRGGQPSYSRGGNRSYAAAEETLAALDEGAGALVFASGMAAATAALRTLRRGERIVTPKVMYHGIRDWLGRYGAQHGVDVASFDAADPPSLERAVGAGPTRLVWIETPVNPTWDVVDIAAAASLAHAAGARLVVDSTVATPVLTRPIALGADLVMHSATKYLNGHSDVIAGALVTARDDEAWAAIRTERLEGGGVLGPFEAWLLQRGMRTLFLRVRAASDNALRLARHFEGHAAVERVLYPGLASHPGHAVAARQMHGGFGGMLSLLVRGDAGSALAVARRTRVFRPATSLGGVESLIEHRATVEGPASPVPANLLRLSVGVEDVEDLIEDLERALAPA